MPCVLKNIVTFASVNGQATVSSPHGLNLDGTGLTPDLLQLDTDGDFTVTANATNITVTNTGNTATSISVLAERWHSIPRALPPPVVNLTPQPFLPSGFPAGSVATDWKFSCRLASTANLPLAGLAAVDGVVPVAGDRVLVKRQTIASQNGIYVAAAGAWARALDADSNAEVTAGMATTIIEGDTEKGSSWVLRTSNPINLGVTALDFQPFLSAPTFRVQNVFAANFACEPGQLVRMDPTGGARIVDLPAINAQNAGGTIAVKNVTASANAITLTPAGADTIDGAATAVIAVARGSLTIVSDGVSNWNII